MWIFAYYLIINKLSHGIIRGFFISLLDLPLLIGQQLCNSIISWCFSCNWSCYWLSGMIQFINSLINRTSRCSSYNRLYKKLRLEEHATLTIKTGLLRGKIINLRVPLLLNRKQTNYFIKPLHNDLPNREIIERSPLVLYLSSGHWDTDNRTPIAKPTTTTIVAQRSPPSPFVDECIRGRTPGLRQHIANTSRPVASQTTPARTAEWSASERKWNGALSAELQYVQYRSVIFKGQFFSPFAFKSTDYGRVIKEEIKTVRCTNLFNSKLLPLSPGTVSDPSTSRHYSNPSHVRIWRN